MKHIAAAAAAVLALAGPWPGAPDGLAPRSVAAQGPLRATTEAEVRRITLNEFKKLRDAGRVIVVDVRGLDSFRKGHIPGSILMPLESVAQRAGELEGTDKIVVTYCT